jgi:D-alanyl-D-alanine-carboxypeptidase/D-alanyl-D-alanine-endopeptidase
MRSDPSTLARRAAATLLAALVATDAAAQLRLDELIQSRIEGDRSAVCLQAARVDLGATPAVTTAQACASARRDAPAPDARFEIGSISKGFVGLLAAEMAARGELRFDEPLSAFLPPGATAPAFEGKPILLADLLTHTAGLPALPPSLGAGADASNPYAMLRADVIYTPLATVRLTSAPGTRYAYSNWGFLLLSDLLARRAGMRYDALLAERVLKPLGLDDTVVAANVRLVPGRMANGRPTPAWDVPVPYAGAGGIRSTLADVVKLASALLGDVPEGAPPSLRTALRTALQPLRAMNAHIDIGAAWHIVKRADGMTLTYHSGMTGGFSSSLVLDTERRRAGIVLADAAGGFEDLAVRIVDGKQPLAAPARSVRLDLPAAQAALGRYELRPGFVLTLALDGDRLYAQATGQGRFELLRDSRGDYYALVADILIRMQRDANGRAVALTLFQGGAALPARRIGD